MSNFVFQRTEPQLWTVGYFDPDGRFHPESDHSSPQDAANRIHWLHGGCDHDAEIKELSEQVEQLVAELAELRVQHRTMPVPPGRREPLPAHAIWGRTAVDDPAAVEAGITEGGEVL
ncbi:MAG: hypothetical protein HOV79_00360 [Hamadaea sp.]|nr:hypothetical protein [Hamadaea sp.]